MNTTLNTPLSLLRHAFIGMLLAGSCCHEAMALVPNGATTLNVKDFGATGNGVTDDTDAINLALAAVKTQKASLYFPVGKYIANKLDANLHTLNLDVGGLTGISIYGDGATSEIATNAGANSNSTLLYVWAYAKSNSVTISHLKFSSTHAPATLFYQDAIFLQGTAGMNLLTPLISDNTFSGFGNSIGAQGVDGLTIANNQFLSPRGHDDSQNSTKPAVHIWFFDNQNGHCNNVTVANNTASGYSGGAPISSLITKRPMDGFVYGTAYGLTVINNNTSNFCEEHIAVAQQTTDPATTAKVSITGNVIDAAIPIGSLDQLGQRKISNYGIRSEASFTTIANNQISNSTMGILVRTFDTPAIQTQSVRILNNLISSAKDPANYALRAGIYLIGNATHPLQDVQIEGNQVTSYIDSHNYYDAINLMYAVNSRVKKNVVKDARTQPSNAPNQVAFHYGHVSGIIHEANTVIGNLTPFLAMPSDGISIRKSSPIIAPMELLLDH